MRRDKGGEAVTLGYKAKKCACIGAPPPEHKYGSASVETDRADDVSTCPNTNTIPTKVRRTMIVISESEDGPGASQRSSDSIIGYSSDSAIKHARLAT